MPRGTPANRSIERATQLLWLFSPDRPSLTLAELSGLMGGSRATTYRYATALRRAGLLQYQESRRTYTLGPRILELAAGALAGLRVVAVAGPHLDRLAKEAGETAVLTIWDGESQVVVRQAESPRTARVVFSLGTRLPLTSAVGKVYCAYHPHARPPELSEQELARVRTIRIAVGPEVEPGIHSVAAPVLQDRDLVGVLALVGTERLTPRLSRKLAELLRETTAHISADLKAV